MRKILLGLILCLFALSASAQVGPPVTQTRTRQDVGVLQNSATGAGNTTVTATLTPNTGQFIYVTMIEIEVGANAAVTGAAVVQACATTNLASNLTFEVDNSSLTVGQVKVQPYYFATPLKTAAMTTAFTVVCSGLQSTQTLRVNIAGYSAP